MPGEERKFKRCRIVAFVPGFNCEREAAASQAEVTGAAGAGVDVEAESAVAVGDGRGVEVGAITFVSVAEGEGVRGDATIFVMVNVWVGEASSVFAGSGSFVAVGVELAIVVFVDAGSDVAVDSEILVTVGEGKGVRGDATMPVMVNAWVDADVAADEIEVSEAGTAVEFVSG